ncbi:MAG TPA: NAD(P)-dependent alcohol dehydrogenase [Acidimicrobiales bacterium]|jgi:aryl-alcohol dehydrogenase|nr:NAD(P)-dependent alcohol dehydrogenase [Acidimicrobiales bacterium]
MRSTAAVLPGVGERFGLDEIDVGEPGAGEVAVRLVASGVCHTDQVVREGSYPYQFPAVLGHEGAGVVEAVGPGVTGLSEGDHVVLSFNSCGQCRPCLSGHPAYCVDFYILNFGGARRDGSTAFSDADGTAIASHFFGQSSFADHTIAAVRSVVKVRDGVDLTMLGPLGCGIQTGAGTVLNALDPEPGSSMAIFGAGAVGDSALLAARVAGATTIIGVDLHDERLATARRLGATETVAGGGDVVGAIMDATGGRGVDYAVDTTGVPAVIRQAADSLATQGALALVAAARPGTEITLEVGASLIKGWEVRTVVEGDAVPQDFIPRLISLFQAGHFPFDQLVKTYPVERVNDAFDDSSTGATIKPILLFE